MRDTPGVWHLTAWTEGDAGDEDRRLACRVEATFDVTDTAVTTAYFGDLDAACADLRRFLQEFERRRHDLDR